MTQNNQLAVPENVRAAQAPAMLSHRLGIGLQDLGKIMATSGYFKDAQGEAQAIVKILYGEELGIQPVSAMMGIHIIEGKPAPSANLVATLIKKHPKYDYAVRYWGVDGCTLEFFENGLSVGEVSFNQQDARNAGLIQRKMWQQYPKAMYFARALTMGARTYAADVFGGAPVYTPEELGVEVDEDGDPVSLPTPRASASASAPSTRKQNELKNAARSASGNGNPQPASDAGFPISDKQKEIIRKMATDIFGDRRGEELGAMMNGNDFSIYTEAMGDELIEQLKKKQAALMNNNLPSAAQQKRDAVARIDQQEKDDKEAARQAKAAAAAQSAPGSDSKLARIFAAMSEKGLPDVREIRHHVINEFLVNSDWERVESFKDLTEEQIAKISLAIKIDNLVWDADGNFYVSAPRSMTKGNMYQGTAPAEGRAN